MELYDNTEWGHGNRPLFGNVLNNAQHGGLTMYYSLQLPKNAPWQSGNAYHEVKAHDEEGNEVGHLQWAPKTGKILDLYVTPVHRRQGVASALFNGAKGLASEYGVKRPQHSSDRSDQGDAWARAVGGRLPRRVTLEDFPNMNVGK